MATTESNGVIRSAVPEDAATSAAVLHDAFIEFKESDTAEAFTTTTPSREQISRRFAAGPIWVAERDGVMRRVSIKNRKPCASN
jgi:hypothetical protein